MYPKLLTVIFIAALSSTVVEAISKISVKGSKFFTEDGNQFYIKGIAYQLTPLPPYDPLLDVEQCQRDASVMEDLGANAIRVYHVQADEDHKGCMDAFADKGIYAFVDLDTFDTQIEAKNLHWNETQLSSFTAVLDEFSKYDNLAGVLIGNEVLTKPSDSTAAPYIKAAARDVKAYRKESNLREIPVGYAAADIASLRPMLQNYLACGDKPEESLDYFCLNAYEWCGDSSYQLSGYSQLQKNASDYPIPIFLSETGCNTVPPRDFADQDAIFGDEMSDTWSGAIIYEYIQEENNYGLVSFAAKVDKETQTDAPDGFVRSGTPTPISPDYSNLKSRWATLTPSGIKADEYSPSATPPPCPPPTSGIWDVDGNVVLPSLGQVAKTSGGDDATATGTAAAPSSSKKASASGRSKVAGVIIGLAGVLLCFIWWL
ncbi:MAG: hypothetical protein M1825_005877 [Sarcosagium campestre]|nr:MAG: hypothetical protein M1825_005877 [Sarcosagium campestre]